MKGSFRITTYDKEYALKWCKETALKFAELGYSDFKESVRLKYYLFGPYVITFKCFKK